MVHVGANLRSATGRSGRFAVVLMASAILSLCLLAPNAFAQDEETAPTVRYLVRRSSVASGKFTTSSVSNVVEDNGGTVLQTFNFRTSGKNRASGDISFVESDSGLFDYLKTRPDLIVEEDRTWTVDVVQNSAPVQLDRIDQANLPLSNSFTYTATGLGTTIYVLDTGIASGHAEFKTGTTSRVQSGYTYDGVTTEDCHGHGTAVASIAAGNTFGVAKNASIVAVRVFDCTGQSTTSRILDGLYAVAATGVTGIINLSFGFNTPSTSSVLENAMMDITALGYFFSVAGGNDGGWTCASHPSVMLKSFPLAVVGASSPTNDTHAYFTSFGECMNIFAPGVNSIAAYYSSLDNSQVVQESGTSFSCALVSGAAAVYLQSNPTATAQTILNSLIASSSQSKVPADSFGSPTNLLFAPISTSGTCANCAVPCSGTGCLTFTQPGVSEGTYTFGPYYARQKGYHFAYLRAGSSTQNIYFLVSYSLDGTNWDESIDGSFSAEDRQSLTFLKDGGYFKWTGMQLTTDTTSVNVWIDTPTETLVQRASLGDPCQATAGSCANSPDMCGFSLTPRSVSRCWGFVGNSAASILVRTVSNSNPTSGCPAVTTGFSSTSPVTLQLRNCGTSGHCTTTATNPGTVVSIAATTSGLCANLSLPTGTFVTGTYYQVCALQTLPYSWSSDIQVQWTHRNVCPSPSNSPTPSATMSRSLSSSPTMTISISSSITRSPSGTPTPSSSGAGSASSSPTSSQTPGLVPSSSNSNSRPPTPSISFSQTQTATQSGVGTSSVTPTSSRTPTASRSESSTGSVSISLSVSPTSSGTPTPSVTASISQSASVTISVSASTTISISSTPSETPTTSMSMSASSSVTISDSRTPTVTVSASSTPTVSRSASPSLTQSPTPTPSNTAAATGTPTSSVSSSFSKTSSSSATASASFTPTISASPSFDPNANVLVWLKFDETSGTTAANSGTLGPAVSGTLRNSPMWRPSGGRLHGAIELDGTDDHVDLGTPAALNLQPRGQNFTISIWGLTDRTTSNQVMFGRGVDDAQRQFMLMWRPSPTRYLGYSGGISALAANWNANVWTMFTLVNVYSGGAWRFRMYLDGGFVGEGLSGTSVTGTPVLIGARLLASGGTATTFNWRGRIDDFRYYGVALSDDNVGALYRASFDDYVPSPEDSLFVHLRLDEGSGTTASNDGNAGSAVTGTLTNGPIFRPGRGVFGGALEFDGVDDYLDLGSPGDLDLRPRFTNFSINFWALPYRVNVIQSMFGKGDATPANRMWLVSLTQGGAAGFSVAGTYIQSLDGVVDTSRYRMFTLVNVLTSSGYVFRGYVDGSLVGQATTPARLYDTPVYAGARFNDPGLFASPFRGLIDDIRVYRFGLTDSFIAELFSSAPAVPSFTPSPSASMSVGNALCRLRFDESGGGVAANSGSAGTACSGNLFNGPTFVPGKFGNAISLDGVDDYILFGRPSVLDLIPGTGQNWTISLWAKSSTTGLYQVLFGRGTAVAQRQYMFFKWNNEMAAVYCGGSIFYGPVLDANWHMLTLVHYLNTADSTSRCRLYVDGATVRDGISGTSVSAVDTVAGARRTAETNTGVSSFFRGQLDELRVYDRALTPTQVFAMFATNA